MSSSMTTPIPIRLVKTGSQGKPLKPVPYYDYRPLPSGWIRLLRIHDDDDEKEDLDESRVIQTLRVSISEYPISSCPDYIALSYTWAEPTVKVDPTFRVFTVEPRCFPIICDNKILRATRNLRDALRRLVQCQKNAQVSTSWKNVALHIEDMGSENQHRCFYWIDALCIDQDDLRERSDQVSLMGSIFRECKTCVVWLGEQDEHIRIAMDLVSKFHTTVLPRARLSSLTSGRDMISSWFTKLQQSDVVSLAIVILRKWFSRIWVLQEAILARTLRALCGLWSFDLELLLFFTSEIVVSNLSTMFRVSGTISGVREYLGLELDISHQLPTGLLSALQTIQALFETRNSLKWDRVIPTAMQMLSMSARCEAGDPRDRIYGLLATCDEFQPKNGKPQLYADYTLPVETLYCKATSIILEQMRNIDLITIFSGKQTKVITGLPTWCPDHTNLNTPSNNTPYSSIDYFIDSIWNSKPDITVIDNKFLLVNGFRYDCVTETHMGGLGTLSYKSGIHEAIGLLELAASVISSRVDGHRHQTPVSQLEALWRMLIMDRFSNKRPASRIAGLFFPAVIVAIMRKDKKPANTVPLSSIEKQEFRTSVRKFLDVVAKLYRIEPQSASFLPNTTLIQETLDSALKKEELTYVDVNVAILQVLEAEIHSISSRAAAAGLSSDLREYLNDHSASSNTTYDGEKINTLFWTEFVHLPIILNDKVSSFATERFQHFGMGHAIQEGDEIWMLHGGNVPVILRNLPNGNYEYCVDVYIQGVSQDEMYGDREVWQVSTRCVMIQ